MPNMNEFEFFERFVSAVFSNLLDETERDAIIKKTEQLEDSLMHNCKTEKDAERISSLCGGLVYKKLKEYWYDHYSQK